VDLVMSARIQDGCLLIEAAGRIFGIEEYKLLTNRTIEEMAKHGTKKAVIDGSLIKWLNSFRLQSEIVGFYKHGLSEEIRLSRIACVVDEDAITMLKFWEFQANQNGFNVRAFCSRNLAVRWVKQSGR
jgi:hypothetical protein